MQEERRHDESAAEGLLESTTGIRRGVVAWRTSTFDGAGVIGGWSGVCGSNTQRQLPTSAVLGVPVGNEVELNWANSLLAVVRK